MTYTLVCSDNLPYLKTLPSDSIDSIVTDPPYGLGKEPDALAMLKAWLEAGHHEVKGSGFMGKEWDAFVPQPALWKECLRVLKPGGHLLAFAGSRTQDLMGLSLRIAGFEIRDCVSWIYGSGFPKSLDISKALDAVALTGRCNSTALRESEKSRPVVGSVKRVVSESRLASDGLTGHGVVANRERWHNYTQADIPVTAPSTDLAKQWEGWGSALKPAYEPCLVARKPFSKGDTIASNVIKHGVGGINIDGCRVGVFQNTTPSGVDRRNAKLAEEGYRPNAYQMGVKAPETPAGRWPANVCLDEEAAEVLDEQTKDSLQPSKGAYVRKHGEEQFLGQLGGREQTDPPTGVVDSGGASRFFYTAKTSRKERQTSSGVANTHPTVKPVSLMRWLVRLVTPPNGTVLDPFNGSGSTGVAAILEGFNYIGVEREQDYVTIAEARLQDAASANGTWGEDGGEDESSPTPKETPPAPVVPTSLDFDSLLD